MYLEIITGYFISKERAVEAAEHLRNQGFKGEISIIGQKNEEDNREADNYRSNPDDITDIYNYGGVQMFAGSFGSNTAMMGGSGPIFAVGPVIGMTGGTFGDYQSGIVNHWGVPKKVEEEIKAVVESGNTVILVSCEESEKQFVKETLLDKGAQNIHI